MSTTEQRDTDLDVDAMQPVSKGGPAARAPNGAAGAPAMTPGVAAGKGPGASAARRPAVRTRTPSAAGGGRRAAPASSNWILMAAFFVALAWSAGAAAYVLGFYGISTVTGGGPERLLGFAFIVIGPALILITLGVVTSEFLRLASFAQSIDIATRRLAAPVDHAQGDARRLADVIAHEVDRVSRSAESALNQLGAMEEVLRHHAEGVNGASVNAREEVDKLIADLRQQREDLGDTTKGLHSEAQKIAETFDQQAEMVSAASDLAAAHADESRQMLERGAERLQTTAARAQQYGEKAAFAISEQMRDMEALVSALDERASRLENLAKTQEENLRVVQSTAHDLNMAGEAGAESMKTAVDTALDQARRLSDMIEQEMRAISSKSAEDIERVRAAADTARLGAENAGRALEANAAAVLERVEQLNDASMHVSHQMDEALQARIRSIENVVATLEHRLESLPSGRDFPHHEPDRRPPMRDHDAPRHEHHHDMPRDIPLGSDMPLGHDMGRGPDDFGGLPARRAPRGDRYEDEPGWEPRGRDGLSDGISALRDELGRDSYGDGYGDRYGDDGHGARGHTDAGPWRDEGYGRESAPAEPPRDGGGEQGWRWKDLLRNIDDQPANGRASDGGAGEAVLVALRRAGIDPVRALDADMTARIARARRRAGVGEARALVLDSAMTEVRRTAAALAADPTLRGRAEGFLDDHARMVRRAVDHNDVAGLSALLDTDPGRAYLLIDAALADV